MMRTFAVRAFVKNKNTVITNASESTPTFAAVHFTVANVYHNHGIAKAHHMPK